MHKKGHVLLYENRRVVTMEVVFFFSSHIDAVQDRSGPSTNNYNLEGTWALNLSFEHWTLNSSKTNKTNNSFEMLYIAAPAISAILRRAPYACTELSYLGMFSLRSGEDSYALFTSALIARRSGTGKKQAHS